MNKARGKKGISPSIERDELDGHCSFEAFKKLTADMTNVPTIGKLVFQATVNKD